MNSQDGRDMDRPMPGSVRRARERAAAGLPRNPREAFAPPTALLGRMDEEPQMGRPSAPRQPPVGPSIGQSRAGRPQAPFTLQTTDGQIGVAISRPTPVPQWPLREPIMAPAQVDGEPFQAPSSSSQPPQRPARPSQVPSILDASKVQDYTPVFQYRPRSGRESSGQDLLPVPETPSSLSRPSTYSSSVGTIPDFPLPIQVPPGLARRSVNLGPPPSARRGASSFYSNASWVSPIPEESPRSRSHTSFASSAAMPENWASPGPSPDFSDPGYGETIMEEPGQSPYSDDYAEESQLVRNASIGKRARPTLVTSAPLRGPDGTADRDQRPGPQPIQSGPFRDGTGYLENSSSSGTIPTKSKLAIASAVTADTMLNAYSSASADDPSTPSPPTTPSPNPPAATRSYSRLSAIRRPPRLDIEAVRRAESRGSLTSLPDLIRRATRLAASLEKGRRPASQFDDPDDFPGPNDYDEKHRSGLSDMLAAFPPPAQQAAAPNRRSIRDSIRDQIQSWPLPASFSRTANASEEAVPTSDPPRSDGKRGRRCCGLPLWGFILLLVVVLILVAAAVVLPVEFFVIRNRNTGRAAQNGLEQCQQQLTCANGGTNVVNQGVCACICANGFTGFNCAVVDVTGCTTTTLSGAMNLQNVTLGNALPRLIQQAQANFSIPLSGGDILAKLNTGNLSCAAENALVTFDGSATRRGVAVSQAAAQGGANAAAVNDVVFTTTITVVVEPFTTFTLAQAWGSVPAASRTSFRTSVTSGSATTISLSRSATATGSPIVTCTVTTTMSMSSGAPLPTPTFTVSEEVRDFARVAVLFIVQEDSLADAETAQVALQRFFNSASSGTSSSHSGVSVDAARNVTVGNGISVDLVNFAVDVGRSRGRVGGIPAVAARGWLQGDLGQ